MRRSYFPPSGICVYVGGPQRRRGLVSVPLGPDGVVQGDSGLANVGKAPMSVQSLIEALGDLDSDPVVDLPERAGDMGVSR